MEKYTLEKIWTPLKLRESNEHADAYVQEDGKWVLRGAEP